MKMLHFPNTLAFKLTFWYTLIIVILISIVFYASYFSLKKTLDHDMKDDLVEGIVEFQILYQKSGLDGVKQEIMHDMQLEDKQKKNFNCLIKKAFQFTALIYLTGNPYLKVNILSNRCILQIKLFTNL